MRFRLALIAAVALFLTLAFFFVSHAYVFLRLTTVLGFMGIVALLIFVILAAGRL